MKAPLDGGPASILVSFESRASVFHRMAVDGTSLYWTMMGDSLMKLTPK